MLAHDIAAALPGFRAEAEALMVDACTIGELGLPSFSDELGELPGAFTEVYVGRCRFQVPSADARRVEFAEREVSVLDMIVQVPVSATGIKVGHVVVCVSSADPDLVDQKFRVTATHAKTHATARRLHCERVVD